MTLPVMLVTALAITATYVPSALPTARVRPQGARAAALVAQAADRSPTVRRLLDRLEAGDVIVYVDLRRDLDPGMAACLTWMAATDTRRIVRASIRHNLRTADAIAILAHELEHAVEVLEHPDVRSGDALRAMYARIGHATSAGGRHFDTERAIATGTLARLEATRGVPGARAAERAVSPGP